MIILNDIFVLHKNVHLLIKYSTFMKTENITEEQRENLQII